jgi:osmotically-inducible protein OsmY
MKTDRRIQSDVMEELKWEPFLNASSIGVAVNNGIVTLSGQVDSYAKKVLAERAARRVAGVRAIAEEIQVGITPAYHKSDAEIAEAILNALKWHAAIQEERIAIKVENGNVRLEGEVESEYERGSAQSTIENLTGVKSVTNLVTVRPKLLAPDIQQKINEAFMRSATIDAGKISAEVMGGKVVLHGKVRSFAEKDDAELAARNAPGVTSVESKLEIETPEYELEV